MKKESDTVQGLEGYSREDILDRVQEHFEYLLEDTDIDAQIVDMRVIGSRANGTASKGSDLDVLLEYKGSAREDGLFNILNNVDDKLYIDGIPVDINPITEGKSGTIAQFLARNHMLDQMESFKRVTGIALQFKAGRPFFDGDIYLDGTKAEYIPDNLRVHGGLFIWDSEISSLPQGLTLDSLSLDNTRVSTLPRDLQVSNVILMNGKEYRTSLQTITKQGFIDLEKAGLPLMSEKSEDDTLSSRSVVPPLSSIMRQYVDFKKSMPDVVPLFHVCGGYETYQGDAERVSKVLDIPVQESATHLGPDGHPAKYVSFPDSGSVAWQETPMAKILSTGLPIAILEDMNKGKGKDVPQSEERLNNVNRDLGRDEERDQSRGFHR